MTTMTDLQVLGEIGWTIQVIYVSKTLKFIYEILPPQFGFDYDSQTIKPAYAQLEIKHSSFLGSM